MATTALVPADADQLAAAQRAAVIERQVAEAKRQAEALEVRTPEEAKRAGLIVREFAQRRKAINEEHKELKAPILEAGRTADRKKKSGWHPWMRPTK